jgi:hypothetical protein
MLLSKNCQLKLIYYTPKHRAYFNKFTKTCTVEMFTTDGITYKILFALLCKVWRFIIMKEENSVYKVNPHFMNYHMDTHTCMYRSLLIIYYCLQFLE